MENKERGNENERKVEYLYKTKSVGEEGCCWFCR